MEGLEAKVLDEAYPVDLELVDLGPELDLLDRLAAQDWAQVVLVDADDAPLGPLASVEHRVLLGEYPFDRFPARPVAVGHLQCVAFLGPIQLAVDLLEQPQQAAVEAFPFAFRLPSYLGIGDVTLLPLQVRGAGHLLANGTADRPHLPVAPLHALP